MAPDEGVLGRSGDAPPSFFAVPESPAAQRCENHGPIASARKFLPTTIYEERVMVACTVPAGHFGPWGPFGMGVFWQVQGATGG